MSLKVIFTQIYSPIALKSYQIAEEAQVLREKTQKAIVQGWIQTKPVLEQKMKAFWETMKKVMKVGFCILISYFFVYNLPTCFFLGAAAALVFPKEMNATVERIMKVWDSLPKLAKALVLIPAPFTFFVWSPIAAPFIAAAECLWLQERAGIKIPDERNTAGAQAQSGTPHTAEAPSQTETLHTIEAQAQTETPHTAEAPSRTDTPACRRGAAKNTSCRDSDLTSTKHPSSITYHRG